jgi:hypothetical protein
VGDMGIHICQNSSNCALKMGAFLKSKSANEIFDYKKKLEREKLKVPQADRGKEKRKERGRERERKRERARKIIIKN